MSEKRYFERKWEGEYYIFDSYTISEKDFDEKVEYEDYQAFADSMTGEEVTDRLNKYDKEYRGCHNDVLRLEKENEQLKQSIDMMGGRLLGLWANYFSNRWGIWSEAVEDIANELGFKIHHAYDDPISNHESKKERIKGVKKITEILGENEQLKKENKELKSENEQLKNENAKMKKELSLLAEFNQKAIL